jgi:hypothetical protein
MPFPARARDPDSTAARNVVRTTVSRDAAVDDGRASWFATNGVSPRTWLSRYPDGGLVAVALLLAAVLWVPSLLGVRTWPVAFALLALLAAYRVVSQRRLSPIPVVLVAYVGVYAVAAVHGGTVTPSEGARFFLRPLLALAVAALVTTAAQRRWVLVLVVLFAASQIPVTAWQAFDNVRTYGRGATIAADSVTGTLGASQAGIVALVALAAATLVAGGWLAGVLRTTPAAVAALALLAIGAFSSTRAVVSFVVLVALAIAVAVLAFGHDRPGARKVLALFGASIIASAAVYGGTRALYPDAFAGVFSSQMTNVIGGAAAQGVRQPAKRPARHGKRKTGTKSTHGKPRAAPPPASLPSGTALLPGRVAQVRLALRLSLHSGLAIALVGRGFGTSAVDPSYHVASDVPLPERTGATWIGFLLTETGWLGLIAFVVLIGAIAWWGRTLWRRAQPATADRAFGAALPGLAALTTLGAVFATVLDVRGYSIVFWILVGVAISARHDLARTTA